MIQRDRFLARLGDKVDPDLNLEFAPAVGEVTLLVRGPGKTKQRAPSPRFQTAVCPRLVRPSASTAPSMNKGENVLREGLA